MRTPNLFKGMGAIYPIQEVFLLLNILFVDEMEYLYQNHEKLLHHLIFHNPLDSFAKEILKSEFAKLL